MEDITKDFLVKNNFTQEYENVFTYSNKEYILDVVYNKIPYHNRHWQIRIWTSTQYMIGKFFVQTIEQFKMAMKIYNINLNN